MQIGEARCDRIAKDPPRDDFHRRSVVRPSWVKPAAAEDPYGVVEVGLATRGLAANLGAVLVAFERQMGALDSDEEDFAEARRAEVVEYGLRAGESLRYLARAIRRIPFPPATAIESRQTSTGFPIEAQAYLFRSYVFPSQLDRVLKLVAQGNGETRALVQRLPSDAALLADFLERWDGRPEEAESVASSPDD
jgi:hypothetical protein